MLKSEVFEYAACNHSGKWGADISSHNETNTCSTLSVKFLSKGANKKKQRSIVQFSLKSLDLLERTHQPMKAAI